MLLKPKDKCCGCSACQSICPKDAIKMVNDRDGFSFPQIDTDKCIECGLCRKVCRFHEQKTVLPQKVFAASCKSEKDILGSASGGVFAIAANRLLKDGAVIFGAAMIREGDTMVPRHCYAINPGETDKFKGSKYVQTEIGDSYKQAKAFLEEGRTVLFSGTPCQIDGLYGYLGNRPYKNLYTIDLVCHGVPGTAFFQDYIRYLEEKSGKRITGFKFRDKSSGWGHHSKVYFKDGTTSSFPPVFSSYYQLFMDSVISRECCYSCPYAGKKRPGNMTVGDFWGIETLHPEFLTENGGPVDLKKGVSLVLINDDHGNDLFSMIKDNLYWMESTMENAVWKNAQLKGPSAKGKGRDDIFSAYRENGYQAVEKKWKRSLGLKYYARILWEKLPFLIRIKIKKTINKKEKGYDLTIRRR